MVSKKKIKCIFGFHEWKKLGGPDNVGHGKFKQKFICKNCKKIKRYIS